MEKKANAEDAYFRSCQREAAAESQTNKSNKNVNKKQLKEREVALFGKQGAQGINFSKYDNIKVEVKSSASTTNDTKEMTFTDFSQLQLPSKQLQNNIKLMNYKQSTPIQRHAVPLGINGYDLMCCAQTGSGKTCAFLLPVVVNLVGNDNNGKKQTKNGYAQQQQHEPVSTSTVILAPTRELASQIELEAQKLCFNMNEVQTVAVYGGASQQKQLRELAFAGVSGSVVIVATPGRYVVCLFCVVLCGDVENGRSHFESHTNFSSQYSITFKTQKVDRLC